MTLERQSVQVETVNADHRLDREVLANFLSDSRQYLGLEHPVIAGNGILEWRNEPRATY